VTITDTSESTQKEKMEDKTRK